MERNIFCKFGKYPILWGHVTSDDVILAYMAENELKVADVSKNCDPIMQ